MDPVCRLHGLVVHFAAFKEPLGLIAVSRPTVERFAPALGFSISARPSGSPPIARFPRTLSSGSSGQGWTRTRREQGTGDDPAGGNLPERLNTEIFQ